MFCVQKSNAGESNRQTLETLDVPTQDDAERNSKSERYSTDVVLIINLKDRCFDESPHVYGIVESSLLSGGNGFICVLSTTYVCNSMQSVKTMH